MATFLELSRRVASESGTVASDGQLATVVGQTGRLGKIVRWTNEAWKGVQNAHGSWRWMRSTFAGQTVAGERNYAGTDLGVADRFGEFLCTGDVGENRFSIYLTATGVSDEGQLAFMPYDEFFVRCMRGTQTNQKPAFFTITPDNRLALHPIPDAIYTVRGPYRKDIQTLAANNDTPEMPSRFHDLIADAALEMLGVHDESAFQIPLWRLRKLRGFTDLERDQLPRLGFAGPLA